MSVLRRIALATLIVAVFVFLFGFCRDIMQKKAAKEEYKRSAELIDLPDFDALSAVLALSEPKDSGTLSVDEEGSPSENPHQPSELPPEPMPDPYIEALLSTDLSSLSEVNSDIFAWIVIPDSGISYPVAKGEDNSYYLKRTWQKKINNSGTIFIDYRNSSSMEDFNTIFYGHNMRNGTMFAPLLNYSSNAYYKEHPTVYIITHDKVLCYEVFSSYDADVKNGHSYRLGLKDYEGKDAYIKYCLKNSEISAANIPTSISRIITLSTCTESVFYDYATRRVVHAFLTDIYEK